jgi:BirA family biotin operon repressor/biotin-[acetyl-CoA-carboxylase] ligase
LESRLSQLAAGDSRWQEDWRRRCLLTGHTVQLEVRDRSLAGVCRGIDGDGALLLETDAGSRRCLSGIVTRID